MSDVSFRTQEKIAGLLKDRAGLDVEFIGAAALERAVRRRMVALNVREAEEYGRQLQARDEELQELVELVVVPETWFFRNREAFAALAQIAAGEWLPAHANGVLRVLSLPCSTGEEPYSIVMALLDSGLPPERFRVDALDISRRALDHAQQAVYGRNSFRSRQLDFRDRHFDPTPEGYRVTAPVRSQVRFRQANLLDSSFGRGLERYDIIFCRNLLIYFDGPARALAVARIEQLLAPDGTLFVGPAEPFLLRDHAFKSCGPSGAFVFCKGGAAQVSRDVKIASPRASRTDVKGTREYSHTRLSWKKPEDVQRVARPTVKARPNKEVASENLEQNADSVVRLERARRLADAGRLAEAAAMCEDHLREEGASAGAYYLLGLVRDALGDYQAATDCYNRVLYLEPTHTEALIHLALILEKQGETARARRLQERIRRIEERARH